MLKKLTALPAGFKESFSQCGEDMIMSYTLDVNLGITSPSYLDIGAHHPSYLSNSFHFYRRGFSGILVEPDPHQFEIIKKERSRDICLNVGIGIGDAAEADFHVMENRTLSTFSKQEVDGYQRLGFKMEKVIRVPLITVTELLERHAKSTPNILSMDTEGLDLPILNTIDFKTFRPQLICVETMDHEHQQKNSQFTDFFRPLGYMVHSDTYLNTIFIDEEAWGNRRGLPK